MEELQLALTTARVDQRNFGLWINNWQIGQSLNALVTNQLPTGELVLRVGGQQITATADIPIQQGAQLQLEVKELRPVPTLRIISPAPNAPAAAVGGTLQLLAPSGEGLATRPLGMVAQTLQAGMAQSSLPAGLIDTLGTVLRQASRSERLMQPQGVAAAVRESGVFLESGLRAAEQGRPVAVGQDLKAGLFRALGRVDAALSQVSALGLGGADAELLQELKRELEAGIGRITVHQLNSKPTDGSQGRSWQLEIPVQHAGTFHSLRIDVERDGQRRSDGGGGSADDEEHWSVRLSLAPPALGAMEISLDLQGERLGLRLAAERAEVRALLDGGLERLQRSLASRGLELVTTVTAALDDPVQPPEQSSPAPTLDVRA